MQVMSDGIKYMSATVLCLSVAISIPNGHLEAAEAPMYEVVKRMTQPGWKPILPPRAQFGPGYVVKWNDGTLDLITDISDEMRSANVDSVEDSIGVGGQFVWSEDVSASVVLKALMAIAELSANASVTAAYNAAKTVEVNIPEVQSEWYFAGDLQERLRHLGDEQRTAIARNWISIPFLQKPHVVIEAARWEKCEVKLKDTDGKEIDINLSDVEGKIIDANGKIIAKKGNGAILVVNYPMYYMYRPYKLKKKNGAFSADPLSMQVELDGRFSADEINRLGEAVGATD